MAFKYKFFTHAFIPIFHIHYSKEQTRTKNTRNRKVKYFAVAGLTAQREKKKKSEPDTLTYFMSITSPPKTTNQQQQKNEPGISIYPVSQWNEVKQTSQGGYSLRPKQDVYSIWSHVTFAQ